MRTIRFLIITCAILLTTVGCEKNNDTENSSLDVTLKPYTFDKKFPALAIHISRNGQDEGFLYVRFPEIIEAWVPSAGKSLKFYQDNRFPEWPVDLQCEPLQLPVKWQGDEKMLSYTMDFDNGMSLTSSAHVIGTSVVLTHKLHNGTSLELNGLKMWNCVQLTTAPNLYDPFMERTNVLVNNEFQLIRDLVPNFEIWPESQKTHPHFFRAYRADSQRWYADDDNPHVSPHPGYPNDRSMDLTTWQVIPPVDMAILSTLSKDAQWGIATYSKKSKTAFCNASNTCHHADAAFEICKPGEIATITNKVLLFEQNLEELAKHIAKPNN